MPVRHLNRAVISLSLSVLYACGDSQQIGMAPVRYSGFIGETFRSLQPANEEQIQSNQVGVSLDAQSYIWQPWLATVDVGTHAVLDTNVSGERDTEGQLISGDLTLNALPLSSYPVTLRAGRRDSRVEGDNTSPDFTHDHVNLDARAVISSDLRFSAGAGLDRVEQPGLGSEDRYSFRFHSNTRVLGEMVGIGVDYSARDFASEDDDDFDDTQLSATLNYGHTLFEDVRFQSTTYAIREDENTNRQSRLRQTVQGISTGNWRPKEFPFTVTGAFRTLLEDINLTNSIEDADDSDTLTQLASLSVGMNYPIFPGLVANAGVSGTYETVELEAGGEQGEIPSSSIDRLQSNLIGSLAYQAPQQKLLGFDWRWNANTSADLGYLSDEGIIDSESIGAGHTGLRQLAVPWLDKLTLSLSQSGDIGHDRQDGFGLGFSHLAALSYNKAEAGTFTFARLAVSDFRRPVGGTETETQLLNFLLNRQSEIDTTMQWYANLSIQFSRNVQDSDSDSSAGADNTNFTANGGIGFRARELFGVRGLQFTSDLELNSFGFEDVLTARSEENRGTQTGEVRADWSNELRYQIGRLVASAEATTFSRENELGFLMLFRVRRLFGGVYRY